MELDIAAKEGRFEDEGWRIRKDSSRFWANVVITALRDENGNLEGFIKIVKDLTERKKIEEALKEERRLFIGGPIVVFKWKAGEVSIPVLYVSPNVQDVFGYKPEDFTTGRITYSDIVHLSKKRDKKMKFWEFIYPEDRKIVKERGKRRQKGEEIKPSRYEFRVITKDGKIKWIDFAVTNILYEKNLLSYAMHMTLQREKS